MTFKSGFAAAFSFSFLVAYSATSLASVMEPIQEVVEPPKPNGNFAMVAVVQWAPFSPTPLGVNAASAERIKQQNRASLEAYVRQAAAHGAKMIVTSEFGIVGYPVIPGVPPEEDNYRNRQDIEPYVEAVPGPSTEYFGKVAKELGVYIHIGLAERDPATDIYYNTAVAIGPDGEIAAVYRKIHLYQQESNFLSPGNEVKTYQSIFGKVGLIICSDVYSSFPMDDYKAVGVDVLALSTSWAQMNSGWASFTAGAINDHAYLLAANQQYFPDSGVINPDGTAQSHIRQSNGLAYGYLPLK